MKKIKRLNGEVVPNKKHLVSVSREEIGLPSAEEFRNSPKKIIVTKHGGKRIGSGRKASGRSQIVLRLIPEAEKKIRALAERNH